MFTAPAMKEFYRPIAPELGRVREIAAELWAETLELVYGPGFEAPAPGGKLLRPALTLLSAGATGAKDIASFAPMATAMELLHLAALAHDDVIDGADTRRGERSLRSQWDNHTAVLGGDYLVARAIALLGGYNATSVILNAVDSVRQMAEGELNYFAKGKECYELDACIRLAKKKTASLFAISCSTPTYLTDPAYRAPLYAYGMGMGVAFQIADDVLDLVQDAETLGKPSCGDLVEGKRTLPILCMREKLDADGQARLNSFRNGMGDDDRAWVHEMMETTGARLRAEQLALEYVAESRYSLDDLPRSPYRDAMVQIADFVVSRAS